MSKSWRRAIVLIAISLLCWYVEIVINPSNFELILGIIAAISSILCVAFLAIAIIRQIKPDVSSYKIFAWTDSLIGMGVAIYAIYDIMTDTGWFAGLLGWLLLVFVLPVILLLLIIDFVFYKRNKKKTG